MKNVTITLPDDLATRARVAAARQNKSLSRYIADLLMERCARDEPSREEALAALEKFWSGPGYPGVSKAWKGRDALYAEREDELLRRYQSSNLQHRPAKRRKAAGGRGFADKPRKYRHARSKPAKPE
ncbi:MAG TPA: hypothetical protein VIM38_05905 [Alphaproteobacteria bacterium]